MGRKGNWLRRVVCASGVGMLLWWCAGVGCAQEVVDLDDDLIERGVSVASSAFATAVALHGADRGAEDLSAEQDFAIPEPRLAFVNLTGFTTMPSSKTSVKKGWMEVYDGNGHYFRKPVTIAGQGGYTIRFEKKNFVLHFTDEAWNEANGADLRIGNWVKQDAFHFKAFYTDYFRGIGEIGYKVFDRVVADRLPYWERQDMHDESRARCYPDGFPCVVYLNGTFYGVYAWQLKKHHKNMNQKKTVAEHVHLDGNLQDGYLFRSTINWAQFEVRNPKGLYTTSNVAYDGNSPKELMGTNSTYYERPTDLPDVQEAKRRTATVKQYIVRLSQHWSELNKMRQAGATDADMRAEMEQRYDMEGLIDYYVFFYFTLNGDGSLKNWQWFTYDGVRWSVTPYDLDQTFGLGLYGNLRPATHPLSDLTTGPYWWVHRFYQDDIRERYAQLRNNHAFDYDSIVAIINDWYERVGDEFYSMEQQRWPMSPCYSDAVCNEGWEVCDDWSLYTLVQDYSATTTYNAGDVCRLEGRLWRATTTVRGVKPFIRNANRDSIERLRDWVNGRLDFLDAYWDYDYEASSIGDIVATGSDTSRRLIGIYTLGGAKVAHPTMGEVHIFRYSDGTTKKVLVR